jgi:hypothetical protein
MAVLPLQEVSEWSDVLVAQWRGWYSGMTLSTSDLAALETCHEAWLRQVSIHTGGYEP